MNKLAVYMKAHGLSEEQLAKIIGVSQGAISHYCLGKRTPKPEILEKISIFTRNAVTANDFHESRLLKLNSQKT